MQAIIGVIFYFIGGFASGIFYRSYKKVKVWSRESYWIIRGLFSWLIVPPHGFPIYEHSWITTPSESFTKYLQYLFNNHYKVIALKDLTDYIHVKKALMKFSLI